MLCFVLYLQNLLSIGIGGEIKCLSAHEVVKGTIVMIVHFHLHRLLQGVGSKGEILVPLWIEVTLDDATAILEWWTLEFDVGIAGACITHKRCETHLNST